MDEKKAPVQQSLPQWLVPAAIQTNQLSGGLGCDYWVAEALLQEQLRDFPVWHCVAYTSKRRWHSAGAWTIPCLTLWLFLCPIPSLHLCMTLFFNWVQLVTAICLVTSERHWRGLPYSFLLALWIFDNDDNTDLFSYARILCWWLAVRLCPGHLRPSGLLCRSPLFGGTACQQTYEIRIGRCSQLERWIAKLLFLPRGHTTADASKSTCERTLRGCFRSVQLFNLLCNYTCTIWGFFCLTLVCLVTDGCIQLVSTSACFVTRWETPSVSCGKSWVIFCLCWAPAPFLLLLRCCFPWRNANLAGGFAGRLLFSPLFLVLVMCWFANVYLEPLRFV